MRSDTEQRATHYDRLDAFVDAAFAFAVSLLVIAGNDPPANLQDLARALGRAPAFAASFALIALFWAGHRDFSRLARDRDWLTSLLSLTIVFVVLVYVYPLRLLTESAFFWMSGGRLPGGGLLKSFEDLRQLYTVYDAGFTILALLYAGLYARALKLNAAAGATAAALRDARDWRDIWGIVAGAGLVSLAISVFGPIEQAPWLPGMIYGLIPVGIWTRAALVGRARKPVLAEAAE
jgi:uncharacterized membrane protein